MMGRLHLIGGALTPALGVGCSVCSLLKTVHKGGTATLSSGEPDSSPQSGDRVQYPSDHPRGQHVHTIHVQTPVSS